MKTFDNSPCILYFEATSVYTASRAVLVPPPCTAYHAATYYRNNFRVYVCKKKLEKCFDWHHSEILTLSYFLVLLSLHKFTQNTQIIVFCLSKSFEKKWRGTEKIKSVTFVVMYHWHVNSFPVWSYPGISCHQVLALKNIAFYYFFPQLLFVIFL